MRNTAFLDKSADVRMMCFVENGFPASEFSRLRLGPVAMKDEVEYRKEVSLLQEIKVTFATAGHSEDGSRFLPSRWDLCARVTSSGGWLDLSARKLVEPPEALHKAMKSLAQTSDFTVLQSSVMERVG
jgi:acyl-CoA thioester hydrolase